MALSKNQPEGQIPTQELSKTPISIDQMKSLVMNRRSIRQYQNKKIPRNVLLDLLEMVRYAPSAMNLQTVKWQIIYDGERVRTFASHIIGWMKQMESEHRSGEFPIGSSFPYIISEWEKGRDLITHGAPHLLITYATPDEPTATTDAIIATSYLDLIAPVFHLGTCWAGILKRAAEWSPDVLATMDLPQGSLPLTAMLIGYPAYRQYTIPGRETSRYTLERMRRQGSILRRVSKMIAEGASLEPRYVHYMTTPRGKPSTFSV